MQDGQRDKTFCVAFGFASTVWDVRWHNFGNRTYAGQCQYPDRAINLNEYGMQAVIAGKLRIFLRHLKQFFHLQVFFVCSGLFFQSNFSIQ